MVCLLYYLKLNFSDKLLNILFRYISLPEAHEVSTYKLGNVEKGNNERSFRELVIDVVIAKEAVISYGWL